MSAGNNGILSVRLWKSAVLLCAALSLTACLPKDMFRSLQRGKRFYISNVRAIGPDNVERLLPTSLEVIIN